MKTIHSEITNIDELFNNFSVEIEQCYSFLSENVKKFQTFDLLSCVSYYNHLHDSEQYSDFRGDRNFFIPEVLALLCLKSEFVTKSTVLGGEYMELIMQIQKTVLNYCTLNDAIEIGSEYNTKGENTISNIANLLSREAKQIRNPGLPDHHLIFTEKLFEPIKDEIKSLFGFSITDSVSIRKNFSLMINEKCETATNEALVKASKLAREIIYYKKTKIIESENTFTKEQIEEYSKYSNRKIKRLLKEHFLNELYYTFGNTYTFTAEELSLFTKVELDVVEVFLKTFSCHFPSLKTEDKIYESITILKTKPIIEYEGRYLIPSSPLLIWAVEEFIFDQYYSSTSKVKSSLSISDLRHDFVLEEGYIYLKKLLPTAYFFPANIKYHFEGKLCETDGLIIYDRVLFIIEAKGHRITTKSKQGNELRTEKHLKQIVKESFEQGHRTVRYISQNEVSEFKPKKGERFYIANKDFDEIVIISLIFEPIGNLSMLLKATNDINFFKDEHFPWIISIYDLVILADLLENPLLLIHYIKQRKKFLSCKMLSTYEELDLFSYFLLNRLYIEDILKEVEEQEVTWVEFMPNTDAISDYYMFKFGYKTKFTEKPKLCISKELNELLLQFEHSKMPYRVRIALAILEFNDESIKQMMEAVRKIKTIFAKDNKLHNCSIYTSLLGGIGVTFMTGSDKDELDFKLYNYCNFKMVEQNANIWIGLGDASTDVDTYEFKSMFFAMKENIK